jgi:hypothetical protein
MTTFFTGLVIAALLTLGAIYLYGNSYVTTVADAHLPGVHVSAR